MHAGDGASLQSVDMFCYQDDMLSVDDDADAVVDARVSKGWNKLRQLVSLLTNKDNSRLRRWKLHRGSVQSSCYMGVKPGQLRKRMSWHFSRLG